MESGDGFIARLSVRATGLRAHELRALLRVAAAHGSGQLEITRRGKLQVRGVRADSLRVVQAELEALGLGEHDALVVNPLAGLSAQCAPLEAAAADISRALAQCDALARLSAKFGVGLDSGGVLRTIGTDLHFDVDAEHPESATVRVAGPTAEWIVLGTCLTADCARAAVAFATELARYTRPELTRIRDLVRVFGSRALQETFAAFARHEASQPHAAAPMDASAAIGFHRGARAWLGLGLAFGSADAKPWLALAELAERFGTGELRISPFRGVILPDVSTQHAAAISATARDAGWIVDASDPLLRAVACPGAPACSSAHGETRALARSLARELLPRMAANTTLHVSGCSKGCALSGPASITVVCSAHHARDGHLGLHRSATDTAALPALALDAVHTQLFELARARQDP